MAYNTALEPFLEQARVATGPLALVSVIDRALRAKDTFLFGELLDLPAVTALREAPAHAPAVALLELFAFGTWAAYEEGRAAGVYAELAPGLARKLRMLTVASVGAERKHVEYAALAATLGVTTDGEVEDAVVGAMDAELLTGKLDQRSRTLEVVAVSGRDVRLDAAAIAHMAGEVAAWRGAVQDALAAANDELARHTGATAAAEEHKSEVARAYADRRRAAEAAGSGGGGGGGGVLGGAGGPTSLLGTAGAFLSSTLRGVY